MQNCQWHVYYLGELHVELTRKVNECDCEESEVWSYLSGTVPYGFDPHLLYQVKGAP
jgi:hypothetical protein